MTTTSLPNSAHPAPGKSARLLDLLKTQCKNVHEKESYAQRYLVTQQIGTPAGQEEPDILLVETYDSEAQADQHGKEPHFQELFAAVEKEGLLGKAPFIAKSVSKEGFDLDRKLL